MKNTMCKQLTHTHIVHSEWVWVEWVWVYLSSVPVCLVLEWEHGTLDRSDA